MKRVKIDWFLIGLGGSVALAWLAPGPGAHGGWMHPEIVTKAGVALIFFLHGLRLSFAAMRAGALNWRLHLLIQSATFIVFPLLGLALYALLGSHVAPALRLGVFYLCALPSTISSAIILTAMARGNVAGAVFNATISNLLGVVITPLWIAVAIEASGELQAAGPVILDLVRWLVLPLVVGQSLRPWLGEIAARHRSAITLIDRGAILLLVYTAFCDSFKSGVWSNFGAVQIAWVIGLCGALFTIVITMIALATRALRFSWPDRIAAMFGGSKKTLAAGVPMAKLIFGSHPGMGLILLPIMIYHPLQLVICGILAQRWAVQAGDTE